jgi:hypothetical protein
MPLVARYLLAFRHLRLSNISRLRCALPSGVFALGISDGPLFGAGIVEADIPASGPAKSAYDPA